MTLRGLKIDPGGSLLPPYEQRNGHMIPAMDIDDDTGQVYSAGQPIGFISRTVLLSSVQLLSLKASPVELIPAPGIGKVLILDDVFFQYIFNGTPYTGAGNNDIAVFWKPINVPTDVYIELNSRNLIDQSANQVIDTMVFTPTPVPQASVENQPMMIANVGVGEWTNGNGELAVNMSYRIAKVHV